MSTKEKKDTYDPKAKAAPPATLQSVIEQYLTERQSLILILLIAVLIRSCVGLSPYSGEGIAPKFGDFECHRHWMETTFHYPVNKWYSDGEHMNITYWPMDYPPLCAYTHWFMANIVAKF